MVSTTKELSEKVSKRAHLQSRGYKVLVELYNIGCLQMVEVVSTIMANAI